MRSLALLLLLPAFISAAGTLTTADLLNSLRGSNPTLVKTLESGFDLDKDAQGTRIGRGMNAKLAGTRIGPYALTGTIHGNSARLAITLNTEITFRNPLGKRTSNVSQATTVTEKLTSITLTSAN